MKDITRKQKLVERKLYGNLKRQKSDISYDETWKWLRKGNPKRKTESLQMAAQNNTIRTNYVKAKIVRRNKIGSVGYVVIESKQLII